jgi:hypothetical protein
MAAAMTANGIIRESALKARLGAERSAIVSAASGIVLIQLIARWAMRSAPVDSRDQVAGVALLWLSRTFCFELTFGHWIDKKSWSELFENYNLLHGRPWPIVLATLIAVPFLWGSERLV